MSRVVIEVTGYGNARDADGFVAAVGTSQRSVPWNGSVTFDGLTPGSASVTLSGVAPHCAADADAYTQSLTGGHVDTVRFSVGCFGDLAFVEEVTGGDWHIVYMDTLGVLSRRTTAPGRQVLQQWSPDGTRFTFQTNESSDRDINNVSSWDIAALSLTASPYVWLSASDDADQRPRWSQDGNAVVYQRWRYTDNAGQPIGINGVQGKLASSTMHIVQSDGSGDRLLLDSLSYDLDPDWTRANSTIVFGCRRTSVAYALCGTPASGGAAGVTQIDGTTGYPQQVSASPDGTWIAYMDFDPEQAIWVEPASGGRSIRLAPTLPTFDKSWSPDGAQLAVNTLEAPQVYGVRTVRRDGTGLSANLTAFSANVGLASWSTDGRWLVVSAIDSAGGQHLYVMGADGSARRQLTFDTPQKQFIPLWRPTSRFVPPPTSLAATASRIAGPVAPPMRAASMATSCAAMIGSTVKAVTCAALQEGVH